MKKMQMMMVGQKLKRAALSCVQVMSHTELLLYPCELLPTSQQLDTCQQVLPGVNDRAGGSEHARPLS